MKTPSKKDIYTKKYLTFVTNREIIFKNEHLLSGEAIGYREHNGWGIVIPRGYKVLKFTEKQTIAIEKYLLENKSFKEISDETGFSVAAVRGNYKAACEKLDDKWTSIFWSKEVLEQAQETYSKSLVNFGFSNRTVHHLVRRADVTNIDEFFAKSLDEYKKLFGKTKLLEEIIDKYISKSASKEQIITA